MRDIARQSLENFKPKIEQIYLDKILRESGHTIRMEGLKAIAALPR